MRPLLPFYLHPAEDPAAWLAVAACGPALTVVVNVHNGPGADPDPEYAEATRMLVSAGVRALGYVHLDYGARPVGQVLADIARWSTYPVSGVFLDCAPADRSAVARTALVVRACRRSGLATVVLNPGVPAHPAYHELADGVCTFEGHWVRYRAERRGRDRPRAGHLVHGVPPEDLDEALDLVRARGVGWGCVTDLAMPLPWRGVPRSLSRMVEAYRT